MSGSQTFQRITEETIEEHRQIHFFLDQITVTLDGLKPGMPDAEPMRRLAAQLQGLEERLGEHHESEEKNGLFQAILETMPESRVEISRLVNQHEKMIEILEMARLHAQDGEPGEAAALREDLERFLEMFRAHERDEELLLRRAMRPEPRPAVD